MLSNNFNKLLLKIYMTYDPLELNKVGRKTKFKKIKKMMSG